MEGQSHGTPGDRWGEAAQATLDRNPTANLANVRDTGRNLPRKRTDPRRPTRSVSGVTVTCA
jgi:hypothetical protein